jgi:peptidyl-prolyl cis-trans isomerase SurA
MRFAILLLLLSITGTALSQTAKVKKEKSQTLFAVAGKPVTTDEFIYLYKKNHSNGKSEFSQEKIDEYFNLFVNFKLKVEEARQRRMDTTAAFQKEFNQYKEDLKKPYLPEKNLIDSLVRLTYARINEEIKASHILVNVAPEASPQDTLTAYQRIVDIRNQILKGKDFGEMAAQFSDDPSAKMNRGDLGYFTALQMVFPFESAAYNTPVGSISNPVRTRFGYHIIKVSDRRPAHGEVEVSHIIIRTGMSKTNDEAKNLIFDIYDELRAGGQWNELCKKYSEDPGTRDFGGKMRPFKIGMMGSVPEFERIAFELKLPGEISDPFQTQYGWHIIRLERKIPIPRYEDMETKLKSEVSRDERTQISKQAMQTKLRNRFQWKENKDLVHQILVQADSTLQSGQWRPKGFAHPEKDVLFTLSGNPYSMRDFTNYLSKNEKPNAQAPQKYLEHLYNNFVDASIQSKLEERIVQEHPEFTFLLNEYYEGILLFEIMEKEVWTKASNDSTGQRSFYESHKEKYTAGERAKATIYWSSATDFQGDLKSALKAGDDKRTQEIITRSKVRVESGYFRKDEKLVFRLVPWEKGIHEADKDKVYYVAWIKDILPAGVQSFEEARPAIVSEYQNYLEKNWVDQLKKKYPVKISEKAKSQLFQKLQTPSTP